MMRIDEGLNIIPPKTCRKISSRVPFAEHDADMGGNAGGNGHCQASSNLVNNFRFIWELRYYVRETVVLSA